MGEEMEAMDEDAEGVMKPKSQSDNNMGEGMEAMDEDAEGVMKPKTQSQTKSRGRRKKSPWYPKRKRKAAKCQQAYLVEGKTPDNNTGEGMEAMDEDDEDDEGVMKPKTQSDNNMGEGMEAMDEDAEGVMKTKTQSQTKSRGRRKSKQKADAAKCQQAYLVEGKTPDNYNTTEQLCCEIGKDDSITERGTMGGSIGFTYSSIGARIKVPEIGSKGEPSAVSTAACQNSPGKKEASSAASQKSPRKKDPVKYSSIGTKIEGGKSEAAASSWNSPPKKKASSASSQKSPSKKDPAKKNDAWGVGFRLRDGTQTGTSIEDMKREEEKKQKEKEEENILKMQDHNLLMKKWHALMTNPGRKVLKDAVDEAHYQNECTVIVENVLPNGSYTFLRCAGCTIEGGYRLGSKDEEEDDEFDSFVVECNPDNQIFGFKRFFTGTLNIIPEQYSTFVGFVESTYHPRDYSPLTLLDKAPDIFWNIVYWANKNAGYQPRLGGESLKLPFMEMLARAIPRFDWSGINLGRERLLSEKAAENCRQVREGVSKSCQFR